MTITWAGQLGLSAQAIEAHAAEWATDTDRCFGRGLRVAARIVRERAT